MNIIEIDFDVLTYHLLGLLRKIDLLNLKSTCKFFHQLVSTHKKKILINDPINQNKYLFFNKIDFWCNILIEKPFILRIEFFSKFYKLDEYLIIAIAYLLTDRIYISELINLKISHSRYDLHLTLTESELVMQLDKSINFRFDVNVLLQIIENYDDNLILKCINNIPNLLKKTTKPWSCQDEDGFIEFYHNQEEFFWQPIAYLNEDWFIKRYPNIHNVLNIFNKILEVPIRKNPIIVF
ncbi:Hypothetical protein KVN_LOCUS237 [uncultured virus]|nr:Hypothetical protein KVN_LOCUS237 [uncultured virus]